MEYLPKDVSLDVRSPGSSHFNVRFNCALGSVERAVYAGSSGKVLPDESYALHPLPLDLHIKYAVAYNAYRPLESRCCTAKRRCVARSTIEGC